MPKCWFWVRIWMIHLQKYTRGQLQSFLRVSLTNQRREQKLVVVINIGLVLTLINNVPPLAIGCHSKEKYLA